MEKPFDQWNMMKKRLEMRPVATSLFFYEREVWWCSVGINIGVETDGMHYLKIVHDQGVSYACLSQMKTVSSKRLLRKIGMIAENEFDAICTRITDYIKKSDPALGGVLGGRSH